MISAVVIITVISTVAGLLLAWSIIRGGSARHGFDVDETSLKIQQNHTYYYSFKYGLKGGEVGIIFDSCNEGSNARVELGENLEFLTLNEG
jgi:hypothetical protein